MQCNLACAVVPPRPLACSAGKQFRAGQEVPGDWSARQLPRQAALRAASRLVQAAQPAPHLAVSARRDSSRQLWRSQSATSRAAMPAVMRSAADAKLDPWAVYQARAP